MKNNRFKFRIWDKENKYMFFNGYNDWNVSKIQTHDYLFLDLDGKIYKTFEYCDECHSLWSLMDKAMEKTYDNYILMQSTGITDKDSQLIYEADILREYDEDKGIDALYEVIYNDNGQFVAKLLLKDYKFYKKIFYLTKRWLKNKVVVGHKYQLIQTNTQKS